MTFVEKRGVCLGGGCLQFGRGDSWDGEQEGEIGEERVDRVVIY
jgi:hypothetical protein